MRKLLEERCGCLPRGAAPPPFAPPGAAPAPAPDTGVWELVKPEQLTEVGCASQGAEAWARGCEAWAGCSGGWLVGRLVGGTVGWTDGWMGGR